MGKIKQPKPSLIETWELREQMRKDFPYNSAWAIRTRAEKLVNTYLRKGLPRS